jgi:hypothetical protein
MADTPDPHELARRYLDLWQQHLTQAATDPELAATMAKFWQNLPAAIASGIPGWPPGAPPGAAGMGMTNTGMTNTGMTNTGMTNTGAPDDDASGSGTAPESSTESSPESAAGPTPDTPSSDGSGDDIDELRNRMAALEKRLGALEPKPRSRGKRAAKGSGKRKS